MSTSRSFQQLHHQHHQHHHHYHHPTSRPFPPLNFVAVSEDGEIKTDIPILFLFLMEIYSGASFQSLCLFAHLVFLSSLLSLIQQIASGIQDYGVVTSVSMATVL